MAMEIILYMTKCLNTLFPSTPFENTIQNTIHLIKYVFSFLRVSDLPKLSFQFEPNLTQNIITLVSVSWHVPHIRPSQSQKDASCANTPDSDQELISPL